MKLINLDCLIALKELQNNSVDSLITDPPAGISFMGKAWDDDKGGRKQWVAWMTEVMTECLRVLKPGAHGLVWALPRTSHWTATALEDAGFEVRDVVTHLFGTGFPKSHNIGRTVKEFEGWGTALKPASEHWILVRKPCSKKTVAANVLKHGTGGINIDASRIAHASETDRAAATPQGKVVRNNFGPGLKNEGAETNRPDTSKGRFPANLVLTEGEATEMLDEQSGITKSSNHQRNNNPSKNIAMSGDNLGHVSFGPSGSGGASRFFYCAKISSSERGEGNTHPTVKPKKLMSYLITMITPVGGIVLDPFMGSGSTGIAAKEAGFDFIGIEKEEEYFNIAEKRIN